MLEKTCYEHQLKLNKRYDNKLSVAPLDLFATVTAVMSFLYLSKILPLLIYPLGLACVLLSGALVVKKTSTWSRKLTALAMVLLWVSSNRWVANTLARSLEWQYLPQPTMPHADAIVLLGGGSYAPLPPRQLPEMNEAGDRVLYAAWLYHQGKADHILVSSGNAVTTIASIPPAADSMKTLLLLFGVPEEAIWQETQSRNTYENGLYSKEFLAQKGINRILLVTSAMHMPRSVRIFAAQGFEVIPAPTDYQVTEIEWAYQFRGGLATLLVNALPQPGALSLTSSALKEYIGIVVYWLNGWL